MSSKGERTRRAIVETAVALFRDQGPARVTMADVAAAAGLTRQAVYLHFPSRTALMLALVQQVGEQLGAQARFGPDSAAPPSARAALLTRLRAAARYSADLHDVASVLDVARHSDDAVRAAWDNRMAIRKRKIRELVGRLHAEGELAAGWTAAQVADALCTLSAPRTYTELAIECRWSLLDYERFLVATAEAFLVPRSVPPPTSTKRTRSSSATPERRRRPPRA
jgi:AcrR family transcriptional regulator